MRLTAVQRRALPQGKPRGRSRAWLVGVAAIVVVGLGALVALGVDWNRWRAPEGMVWIPAGSFEMGSAEFDGPGCPECICHITNETLPIHTVELDGFWIDQTPVTNAQFKKFVDATGYVTQAEKPFNGKPAGSAVFAAPAEMPDLHDYLKWWKYVEGADWRHPEGPGSSLYLCDDKPVVHVSWDDAQAYVKWAGKRLPTEAEFEYAARGGLSQKRYVWGDELNPDGKWLANIWQGRFPVHNTKEDGWYTTSPVRTFPANGYGLYDMSGNVWDWCSDWYRPDYYEDSPRKNPQGPAAGYDPAEPDVPKRVQRGGSFLCSDSYCKGYMPGSRGKGEPSFCASHIGFRCVRSAK
jgi:formylglycine-generating enzyme required for sulfatase activity